MDRDTGRADGEEPGVPAFDGVVGSLPDPVCALDGDRRIVRLNGAFRELTGYDADTLRGRPVTDLLAPGEPEPADRLAAVVAGDRETTRVTFPVVTRAGGRVPTEVHATREAAGCLCVFRRVERRERYESQLELLKQVLTRVLRHNIRNELDVIQSHAEEVIREADTLADHGEAIRRRCQRLLGHSQKAREFERSVGDDTLERVDLDEVVAESLDEVITDGRDEVVADSPGDVVADSRDGVVADSRDEVVADSRDEVVAGSRDEVQTDASDRETIVDVNVDVDAATVVAHTDVDVAIRELLSNAVEHAPSGSTPRIDIWTEQHDETVTLFVEDTAGGISDHEIDVVRRGTETAFDHASGVGLWLVRWLVDASGAELVAHTTGEGSLFGIRFQTDRAAVDRTAGTPVRHGGARPVSTTRVRDSLVVEREEIRRQLADTLAAVPRVGGQTLVVTGEAGAGKTTVVERFRQTVADRGDASVVAGRCRPDATEPLAVFRDAFADEPFGGDVATVLTDPDGPLADDPETAAQRRRGLFSAVVDAVGEAVADGPVVLVVEDLHWAGEESIALLERLVDEVGQWGRPLFILATARVPVDGDPPARLANLFATVAESRGEVVSLPRLDESAVGELLTAGLGVDEVPDSLVDAVLDHTDGVPLLVQELIRQVADRVETGGALPTDLSSVSVPASLEAAVDARLSDLEPATATVLETGAVFGGEFSFDELRAATHLGETELLARIDDLVARGLWTRAQERLSFRKQLVRERVLDDVSSERVETLHRRAVDAIESVHDDLTRHAGRLVTHYDAVGEPVTAAAWAWRAGQRAAETHAYAEAVERYAGALDRVAGRDVFDAAEGTGDTHTLGVGVFADYAEALAVTDEPARAQAVAARGLARCPQPSSVAARLYGTLAELQESWGNLDRSRAAARQQRAAGEAASATAERLAGRLQLGSLDRLAGDWEAAERQFEQVLTAARDAELPTLAAAALDRLGTVAVRRGDYAAAEPRYEESLSLRRATDDRVGVSVSLNNLGLVAYGRNDQAGAAEYFQRGLEIDREIGNRTGAAQALYNVAMVEMDRGEYQTALERCREALSIREAVDDTHGRAECHEGIGIVHLHWGEYDEARTQFERSLSLRQTETHRYGQVNARVNLGEVARYRGRYETAAEQFETALAVARELDAPELRALARTNLAETALCRDRVETAAAHVETALERAAAIDDARQEMATLRVRAAVARHEGRHRAARAALRAAARLDDTASDPRLRLRVELEAVRVELAAGRVTRAADQLAAARAATTELTVPYFAGQTALLAGRVAFARGDESEATVQLADARETFRELGTPAPLLETAALAAERHAERGSTSALHDWARLGRRVFETAPDPVREQFEGTFGRV